ncbi:hypothetical protein ACI8AC_14790 [Geodermatophilus sp. SYSU D00758]
MLDVLTCPLRLTFRAAPAAVPQGDPVPLVVRATADRDAVVTGGVVELVRDLTLTRGSVTWTGHRHTVGERCSTVEDTAPLPLSGRLAAGEHRDVPADLLVPTAGAATVDGRLVQQGWRLRARVRVDGARDAVLDEPLRVPAPGDRAPGDAPAGLRGGGLRIDDLRVDGAAGRLTGGALVSGAVPVAPGGTARGLRVELVLAEHVPPAPGAPLQQEADAETVVARTVLAPAVDRGAVPRFTLRAPDRLPAPTVRTPAWTARWLLRAVLDRRLRRDLRAEVELTGSTAG